MRHGNEETAHLQYDGPDSIFDEITEEHFRSAILYIVTIFSSERDYLSEKAYIEALMPYDFDYRCAKRTLERYAIEVLHLELNAMRQCHHRYSTDPSFYRDGLPRNFVAGVLDAAWANIRRPSYIRVTPKNGSIGQRH